MQDVAAISGLADETQPAPSVPALLPVCPHCADDPARLSIMPQQFPGGMIGSIFFCGNPDCRKVISVQILGMAQPQQPTGPQIVK